MKVRLIVFIFFALLLNPCHGFSQAFDYKENSAYIYNFIKYIDWATKKTNLTVGVIGKSPIAAELRNLVSRKKNPAINLSVRNIEISESRSVDVIIVSEKSSGGLKEIDHLTQNLPILIISEKENQCRFGACISFFMDEEKEFKTQYQLSVRNCRARGLIVSDQILNNAVLTR